MNNVVGREGGMKVEFVRGKKAKAVGFSPEVEDNVGLERCSVTSNGVDSFIVVRGQSISSDSPNSKIEFTGENEREGETGELGKVRTCLIDAAR